MFIDEKERRKRTTIGPQTWSLMEKEGTAPMHVQVSPRIRVWVEGEIKEWQLEQISKRAKKAK